MYYFELILSARPCREWDAFARDRQRHVDRYVDGRRRGRMQRSRGLKSPTEVRGRAQKGHDTLQGRY